MEQALRIMVRNAARFAASERAELVVSATTKDGQWVVSFLDNGTPIASEAVQHLFKIEVNDTHEPAVPALALVRKMVERYGGSIEVDTEYVRGAHLLLRFPVAPVEGVTDTTAAGDSFNGAYLAALLAGDATEQAIQKAQHCSGRVFQNKGALIPSDVLLA